MTFLPKIRAHFPIFEKGQGASPLPPSSYAPDLIKLLGLYLNDYNAPSQLGN